MDKEDIKNSFNRVFSNEEYFLPIRCEENGYYVKLSELFELYKAEFFWTEHSVYSKVCEVCDLIIKILNDYLDGKPQKAFCAFKNLYSILGENFLSIYSEINMDPNLNEDDSRHSLFRMRKVDKNSPYLRKEIFHTPFSLRNRVATNRYSIAGYPCLYLSSSIELCMQELEFSINPGRYIISRFEIVKDCPIVDNHVVHPRIIELGIKPQDFFVEGKEPDKTIYKRRAALDKKLLDNPDVKMNYMVWYPFILACSFIRPDKNTPFSIEYVLPQLLMQYVREEIKANGVQMGIRYFSCASVLASELGFNYVFPSNFEKRTADEYCGILTRLFQLTEPIFVNEYTENRYLLMALRNKKLGYYNE